MPTPNRSAKKKKYTPPSPQSAKSARAARANKRAPASQSNLSEAEMASARVDEDIHVVTEVDRNNSQHIEPNVIINPGESSSDLRPDSGFNAGTSSSADQSRSRSRQSRSERDQPPPPESRSCGQEQGNNVPDNSSQNPSLTENAGEGGGGDDRSGAASPADRRTEARERAVMVALGLIEEAHDIMQISGSIRLAGQSKLEAKRLLDNVKTCIIELMGLKVPEDDEIFPRLKKVRKDMLRLIMQSDEFEATNIAWKNAPNVNSSHPSMAIPEPSSDTGAEDISHGVEDPPSRSAAAGGGESVSLIENRAIVVTLLRLRIDKMKHRRNKPEVRPEARTGGEKILPP
jgi:hypothetical protein